MMSLSLLAGRAVGPLTWRLPAARGDHAHNVLAHQLILSFFGVVVP